MQRRERRVGATRARWREFRVGVPNQHVPFTGPEFIHTFYLPMTSVNEYWAEVKDKVEVVYPLNDFDYGMRELCVLDNNRYRLQFGEELA